MEFRVTVKILKVFDLSAEDQADAERTADNFADTLVDKDVLDTTVMDVIPKEEL
jgi:hypothetical protein